LIAKAIPATRIGNHHIFPKDEIKTPFYSENNESTKRLLNSQLN
jgi:hypothetical protein